jgi:hypothetical protein
MGVIHVRVRGDRCGNEDGNLEWRFSWSLGISSRSRGNDFQQPRGNQSFRHFHTSTISTPYGGPARPGHGRPAQAAGAKANAVISCRRLRFGVELLDVRVREAAISLCRNGRPFRPNTSPGAFTRRDRANAVGAPAVPRDGIPRRSPREFLIGRSGRARFLRPQSARVTNRPAVRFEALDHRRELLTGCPPRPCSAAGHRFRSRAVVGSAATRPGFRAQVHGSGETGVDALEIA